MIWNAWNLRFLLALGLIGIGALVDAAVKPRFNEIQVIGTHNSYHVAPEPAMMALIEQGGQGRAASIDYSHRPLWEQFAILGVRQIELDVYADPEGGHYARPLGRSLVDSADLEPHDPDGRLMKPGLKVLHVTDFDYRTRVYTWMDALEQIRAWSDENPGHVPITVLVEVKEGQKRLGMTSPIPFDKEQLDGLDREIRSVFSEEKLMTPDSIRGESTNLRDAIKERGWPELDAVRGKILFALDNGGAVRDLYLEGHPSLQGRVLFVSVEAEHPAAAFMKINDPIGDYSKIRESVEAGFIVRTRADSPTRHARENDTHQCDIALRSGAQFVSTDFPEPEVRYSEYNARLPGGWIARANPVIGRAAMADLDGVQGWTSLSGASASRHWQNKFSWGEVEYVGEEIRLSSDRNFMISSKILYDDFVLELEALIPSGNSGVFFRCQPGEKKLLGYQAEIDRTKRQYSGGLYDNTGRGFLVPNPKDELSVREFRGRQGAFSGNPGWNRYRVECFGDRIRVAINGRWITDIEDKAHEKGVIGLQHHGGGDVYRFRNIRLLRL